MLLHSLPRTLRTAPRRGAILIVVVALLTIFAVIAITFVFYSTAEADAARIHKDSIAIGDSGQPDPNEAVNGFLGSLLYPVTDTNPADLTNSLRGHDLARGMYGWTGTAGENTVPFNGVGAFHETTTLPTAVDRARVVNYTAMQISGTTYLYDPEWTGIRPIATTPPYPATVPANTVNWMPSLANPSGRVYIAKNAPYTYPDANNLFLASISPQTGQVLVPSYYRSWQFRHSTQAATATGLEPPTIAGGNPNWSASTNPDGRAFILRPRPDDNIYNGTTEFPYVPANADGTFTGDVQNLTGGYYYNSTTGNFEARNDSLWLNIGLAPRKWNGKWVIPLIAPIVLDLDGRINLSAHGNRPVGGGNAGAHVSYGGYGPWEVNPSYVLGTESAAVVNARQNNAMAVTRSNTTARLYNGGKRLPAYAKVNWSGANGAALQTPAQSGANYTTSPSYPGTGFDDDVTNAATYQTGHPSLFNPAEWPPNAGNLRTFAPGDLRYLSGKYAADREFYQQADIAKLTAPFATPDISLIRGTPGTYTGSSYRLDPVHRNRHAVTPFGATLDVPGNMPGGTSAAYSQVAGTRFANSTLGSYTGTASGGVPITPVDLNRPLTDYRNNLNAPLSAGNIVNEATATAERQMLARDIFARLCIATGGSFTTTTGGYTNGTTVTYYTATTTVGATTYNSGDVQILAAPGVQYDALRGLAQLAVNIVDYIDNDDIMTNFAWNVAVPTEFVFGVEKPRVVINEAYSEIANQWDTMATGMNPPAEPAHVRFWVELLNPTSPIQGALPPGSSSTAIGDGTAPLSSVYRIEIYRDAPATGAVQTSLLQPGNVRGDPGFTAGITPAARFPIPAGSPALSPNNGNYGTTALTPATGAVLVGPTIGAGAKGHEFNPTLGIASGITTTPAAGMAPQEPAMEYLIDAANFPDETALNNQTYKRHVIVLQRLANPYNPNPSATNPWITVDYMDWVPSYDAVTRTLAETMTARSPKAGGMLPGYDPASERYSMGKVQPYVGFATPGQPLPAPGSAPYRPTFSFTSSPKSFVLQQNPNPYSGAANDPHHTFNRHNGNTNAGPGANGLPTTAAERLMSPFDMLVHMDRPLANQMELLHTLAVKPHKVTQEFVRDQPAGTLPLRKDLAIAPWLGITNPGVAGSEIPGYDFTNTQTHNQLYRAFDLLRVRPWTHGAVMNGKVHGRVNINTVQDPRVLHALFDPQGGNGFNTAFVDNTAWTAWVGSRTPLTSVQAIDPTQPSGFGAITVPVPGPTVDDWPGVGTDRPFKPFGVGELNAGTLTGASGLQDTVLRTGGSSNPILWDTAQAHPYQQAEAIRKVLSNTTTMSNTFVVVFTVSYFEVRVDANGNPVYVVEGNHFVSAPPPLPAPPPATAEVRRYILGKEAYREVPGDLRQQFMAVVDRNNIALNASANNGSLRPFHTSLEATVSPGATSITIAASPGTTDPVGTYPLPVSDCVVYADGQPIQIVASSGGFSNYLVIGTGAEQQVLQIATTATVPNPIQKLGTGLYQIALETGMSPPLPSAPLALPSRTYPVGTLVSNARYGNPGPQGGSFDVTDPKNMNYRHVVPYWARTR